MVRPLALIREILFRFAFGVCIIIQLVLWVLLAAGIEALFRSHNSFVMGLVVFLLLLGPFLIGAANYFIYHRIIREEYICTEAEKWLAERRGGDDLWKKRRKLLKHWAVWIPTVTVILACAFLDYTWALASHLLHPGQGRLIGYEVSIPITWTFPYPYPGNSGNGGHSIVVASRFRGLLTAHSGVYAGDRPPFEVSRMNFRSVPSGDPIATKPATQVMSERTLPFGNGTIKCFEEVPPRWMVAARYINCSTSTGDFSGDFSGRYEDAAEFYRVLESVKQVQ